MGEKKIEEPENFDAFFEYLCLLIYGNNCTQINLPLSNLTKSNLTQPKNNKIKMNFELLKCIYRVMVFRWLDFPHPLYDPLGLQEN